MPPSPDSEKMVCIGKIQRAHGIKGALKIQCFTEDPASITLYGPVYTGHPTKTFTLHLHSIDGHMVIASLEGVTTREQAEALRNTPLYIPRTALPPIEEEDTFYIEDLIGMEVYSEKEEYKGTVMAAHNFGAGDILEITPPPSSSPKKTSSFMLAFTKANVPHIHLKERKLIITPPEEDFLPTDTTLDHPSHE